MIEYMHMYYMDVIFLTTGRARVNVQLEVVNADVTIILRQLVAASHRFDDEATHCFLQRQSHSSPIHHLLVGLV